MAVVVTIAKSPSYNKRPLCIIYTYVCKFVVLYIHYIDICMYECVCVCKYIDMCAVYIIKHTFIFKLPIISIKSTFVRHNTEYLVINNRRKVNRICRKKYVLLTFLKTLITCFELY